MARYPGRLFSRDELFDRVWGEQTRGDVGTITVHIRKIREKIEADPSSPRTIITVWGMGYRLVGEWAVRGTGGALLTAIDPRCLGAYIE